MRLGGRASFTIKIDTKGAGTAAGMRSDVIRNVIALGVFGLWLVAGAASVITEQYKTLEIVTPVMMIVTGFLFGYQIQVNKTANKKEGE
jgi:ATP/ADP translocase